MREHTTTTYDMPKHDKHSPQKKATPTKNIGALQHDSRSHQKKMALTKIKCTLSLKWLAALCVLNRVGAATVPPVTMSVTTLSQFVPVSEGTLVTAAGNDWYKTAQWSGMANDGTTQSVAQVLAIACLAAPSCVGSHCRFTSRGAR